MCDAGDSGPVPGSEERRGSCRCGVRTDQTQFLPVVSLRCRSDTKSSLQQSPDGPGAPEPEEREPEPAEPEEREPAEPAEPGAAGHQSRTAGAADSGPAAGSEQDGLTGNSRPDRIVFKAWITRSININKMFYLLVINC